MGDVVLYSLHKQGPDLGFHMLVLTIYYCLYNDFEQEVVDNIREKQRYKNAKENLVKFKNFTECKP